MMNWKKLAHPYLVLLLIVGALTPCKSAIAMDFVQVHAGSFMMGSPEGESFYDYNEKLHPVQLTQDYEIQTTELTQKQYFDVMGTNPSYFKNQKHCPKTYQDIPNGFVGCPNNPVEGVSYYSAQTFIEILNAQTVDGYFYRLPTEAEWEFAARAGTSTAYSYGNDANLLTLYGWFSVSAHRQTHEVAQLLPNTLGLYDMHGNVYEWVSDFYSDDYDQADPNNPQIDPHGPRSGSHRVARGGSWYDSAPSLRSAFRLRVFPANLGNILGFRLVRTHQ